MRFSFAFAGLVAVIFTGLFVPLSAWAQAPAKVQAALVPIVPAANEAADANRTLSTIEASAFFAGKIGGRKITPEETVYVIARPFPRSEERSRTNEKMAYFYDAATKELTLYGGFFQRAAVRDETENTLLLDQTKTFGKPRDEKDDFGNAVTITPETDTTYTVNLNGLPDFDARLYQRNTQRIAVQFGGVNASEARKISRSVQIVLGVRRTGEARVTALLGATSIPRNPQAESNIQAAFTLTAPLTDLFVIDATTKKILFHYRPKPQNKH